MRLYITALGMVSSVGWDVNTACASIRAGLSRPTQLSHYSAYSREEEDIEPIVGHPIQGITEGYFLTANWIQMSYMAIRDMIGNGALPEMDDSSFWSQTGIICITPPAKTERFGTAEDGEVKHIEEAFLNPLVKLLAIPIKKENMKLVCEGNAGLVSALTLAQKALESNDVERIIILGVDSYLDPLTIDWIANSRRLKNANQPNGLIPGEAAACVLVESKRSHVNRNVEPLAYISDIQSDYETNNLTSNKPNIGDALFRVGEKLLAKAGQEYNGLILVDLNGESWRSTALGNAQVKLQKYMGDHVIFQSPAESLGETGAATGAICICMAVRGFVREYNESPDMLILLNSEDGLVGGLFLHAA